MAQAVKRVVSGQDWYYPIENNTVTDISPGLYTAERDDEGFFFMVKKDYSIDYSGVQRKTVRDIKGDVEIFIGKREAYKSYNIPYKRGIALSGRPGSGKTVIACMLCKELAEMGYISLFYNNDKRDILAIIKSLRNSGYDKLIVIYAEEVDKYDSADFTDLALLLDGEDKIDNVLFICTMNDKERLPEYLLSRPSRIDKFYSVDGIEEDEEIIAVLAGFNIIEPALDLISECRNKTFAEIQEIITIKYVLNA